MRNAESAAAREVADASAASYVIADLLAVRSGQRWIYMGDAALECILIASRHLGIGQALRPSRSDELRRDPDAWKTGDDYDRRPGFVPPYTV